MSIEDQGHFFTIYFQVLYVLCFTRQRYQVSVYRTIGPLVNVCNFGYRTIGPLVNVCNFGYFPLCLGGGTVILIEAVPGLCLPVTI